MWTLSLIHIFVLGQEFKRSGREILVAVVLGYDVGYRIASHMNPKQINKGFQPSSNCDVFGAMAVAGKLMGLNEKQLANGLGQAGMLASGTMEATCSGQRSKCVQVGNAAYSGICLLYTSRYHSNYLIAYALLLEQLPHCLLYTSRCV